MCAVCKTFHDKSKLLQNHTVEPVDKNFGRRLKSTATALKEMVRQLFFRFIIYTVKPENEDLTTLGTKTMYSSLAGGLHFQVIQHEI